MKEYTGFRADRLKKAMKENGATIEDIAKSLREEFGNIRLDFAYMCEEWLIRKDDYNIPARELIAVCKAVNVSADYLLGLSDEM